MGKVNRKISFDKVFLNQLKNDPNACVEIHTKIHHLALHPFHLTDVNSSIKGILNDKIAKYDKNFGGILLGYENVKLLESAGGINFDSCFIHANIQADFYIFTPNIGQILNGVVNKKSKDHVGCLVHKTFNVSLPKPEDLENWMGNSVQLGQEIQLEIIHTDLEGRLPYIKGKIISFASDDSGFSTSEEPHQQNIITKFEDSDDEMNKSKRKKKRKREDTSMEEEGGHKRKKHKTKGTVIECEAPVEDNKAIEVDRKLKKKKKHKERDRSVEKELNSNNGDVPIKVKKKKKHKDVGDGRIDIDDLKRRSKEQGDEKNREHGSERSKVKKKHKDKKKLK